MSIAAWQWWPGRPMGAPPGPRAARRRPWLPRARDPSAELARSGDASALLGSQADVTSEGALASAFRFVHLISCRQDGRVPAPRLSGAWPSAVLRGLQLFAHAVVCACAASTPGRPLFCARAARAAQLLRRGCTCCTCRLCLLVVGCCVAVARQRASESGGRRGLLRRGCKLQRARACLQRATAAALAAHIGYMHSRAVLAAQPH
jgi:hypothetical protein